AVISLLSLHDALPILKEVVERKLGLWRKRPGMSKARAILIAHSMGGLVARYYLEVLGGWDSCRALITFGTPHRGSLNALDSLCRSEEHTSELQSRENL